MANAFVFSDNASSTLAGAITNTATTLNLQAGAGALFPNPGSGQQFALSLLDAATQTYREIVYVTARSTDTLTIVRAQEGTSARAWAAGDFASHGPTAGQMAAMLQSGAYPTATVYYGVDTGTADNLAVTTSPSFSTFTDGLLFEITPAATNATSAPVVNFNSLGNKTICLPGGGAISPNTIVAGSKFLASYDNTLNKVVLLNNGNKISGNVTYYVNNSTGSDTNTGATTSTAFATISHALSIIQNLDLCGYNATIQLANTGIAYAPPTFQFGNQTGAIVIQGSNSSQSSYVISSTGSTSSGGLISVTEGLVYLSGLTITNTGNYVNSLLVQYSGVVGVSYVTFTTTSAISYNLMLASIGGFINVGTGCIFAGSALSAMGAQYGGNIIQTASLATASGPAFSSAFASALICGTIGVSQTGFTWTGSGASGPRYSAQVNGAIDTGGSGASFYPGSTAGSTATGGQYV